ncbi:MAG: ATP-binding protein [Proteobacteria bacterium]|nr:ATP-binding protein [Pseudomonadota bacterium]
METPTFGSGSGRSKLACKQKDELVDDVLALRQCIIELEQRATERQQTEVALTRINEVLPQFQQLAALKIGADIAIEIKPAADPWPIMVDAGHLKTALLNLAVNARDAMPEGGRLTIETANQILKEDDTARPENLAPGDYVTIAISDSGIGMPADVLAQAFEPFFTTKDGGKGIGLGLTKVFDFAQQSGGHVAIYSEIGHGTTVRIHLPRAEQTVNVEPAPRVPQKSKPTGDETIIVVEDNADLRSYLVRALSRLGYTVLEAGDGPAALEAMAAASKIDLLLTDMILPRGMNGREIAAAFRERYPAAGVLFSSGYSRDVLGRQGQIDENMAFIYKPYQSAILAQRVREVLDGRT